MNIISSLTARFNNSKENLFTTSRKNKTSSLKTDIIINNIIKVRGDDDLDSLNSKNNPRRGNKRKGKPYNKEDNNNNGKVQVAKPDKYHKKREKLAP